MSYRKITFVALGIRDNNPWLLLHDYQWTNEVLCCHPTHFDQGCQGQVKLWLLGLLTWGILLNQSHIFMLAPVHWAIQTIRQKSLKGYNTNCVAIINRWQLDEEWHPLYWKPRELVWNVPANTQKVLRKCQLTKSDTIGHSGSSNSLISEHVC